MTLLQVTQVMPDLALYSPRPSHKWVVNRPRPRGSLLVQTLQEDANASQCLLNQHRGRAVCLSTVCVAHEAMLPAASSRAAGECVHACERAYPCGRQQRSAGLGLRQAQALHDADHGRVDRLRAQAAQAHAAPRQALCDRAREVHQTGLHAEARGTGLREGPQKEGGA